MLFKMITNIKIVTTNCNTMTMSFLLIITTTSSHAKGSRRPKIRACYKYKVCKYTMQMSKNNIWYKKTVHKTKNYPEEKMKFNIENMLKSIILYKFKKFLKKIFLL